MLALGIVAAVTGFLVGGVIPATIALVLARLGAGRHDRGRGLPDRVYGRSASASAWPGSVSCSPLAALVIACDHRAAARCADAPGGTSRQASTDVAPRGGDRLPGHPATAPERRRAAAPIAGSYRVRRPASAHRVPPASASGTLPLVAQHRRAAPARRSARRADRLAPTSASGLRPTLAAGDVRAGGRCARGRHRVDRRVALVMICLGLAGAGPGWGAARGRRVRDPRALLGAAGVSGRHVAQACPSRRRTGAAPAAYAAWRSRPASSCGDRRREPACRAAACGSGG